MSSRSLKMNADIFYEPLNAMDKVVYENLVALFI